MSQFRAIAGVVGAAAVAASTPIELFAADPALSADDANANTSFRVVCAITGSTGTQIRVTFQPGSTNSLSILHASFGKWDTNLNYSNTTATPIELKFGGASGFAGATTAQTSDWADLSGLDLSTGDRIVVIYDVAPGTASTSSQRYNNAATGATAFFHGGDATWDDMDVTTNGFTKLAATNYCIASVETKGAGSSTSGGDSGGGGVAHDIPLSFDDGKFTGMTELVMPVVLENGDDLSHYSIREQGVSYSILCKGNNELSFIRVLSRECIRITDNDLLIEDAYLEAEGVGDDHADTLQAYSPGARGGTVTLRRVHVRAHTTAATAGFFIADNWGGSVVLQDVIIQGGPWGLRFMADGADINISLSNVYFIGPFGAEGGPYSFEDYNGGTHTILQWDNVREATIVDGELVPGNLLPSP
jgi:hypothetical protein